MIYCFYYADSFYCPIFQGKDKNINFLYFHTQIFITCKLTSFSKIISKTLNPSTPCSPSSKYISLTKNKVDRCLSDASSSKQKLKCTKDMDNYHQYLKAYS